MSFGLDEIERYSRQILLPEWGAAGQERLQAARIEVLGLGLCAEVALRYLGAAGVGGLRVATEAQAALVRALNPHVTVELGAAPPPAGVLAAVRSESHWIVAALARGTPGDDGGDGVAPVASIAGAGAQLHVAGAALALEALKALLGLPYRESVGAIAKDPEARG